MREIKINKAIKTLDCRRFSLSSFFTVLLNGVTSKLVKEKWRKLAPHKNLNQFRLAYNRLLKDMRHISRLEGSGKLFHMMYDCDGTRTRRGSYNRISTDEFTLKLLLKMFRETWDKKRKVISGINADGNYSNADALQTTEIVYEYSAVQNRHDHIWCVTPVFTMREMYTSSKLSKDIQKDYKEWCHDNDTEFKDTWMNLGNFMDDPRLTPYAYKKETKKYIVRYEGLMHKGKLLKFSYSGYISVHDKKHSQTMHRALPAIKLLDCNNSAVVDMKEIKNVIADAKAALKEKILAVKAAERNKNGIIRSTKLTTLSIRSLGFCPYGIDDFCKQIGIKATKAVKGKIVYTKLTAGEIIKKLMSADKQIRKAMFDRYGREIAMLKDISKRKRRVKKDKNVLAERVPF